MGNSPIRPVDKYESDGDDQRESSSAPISEVAEYRRPERSDDETGGEERQQRTDHRVEGGKEQPVGHKCSGGSVRK
jgi:hypothetical protein